MVKTTKQRSDANNTSILILSDVLVRATSKAILIVKIQGQWIGPRHVSSQDIF